MTYMTSSNKAGTLRWQSPELLPDIDNIEAAVQASTAQSDIYAFGMVCYEVRNFLVRFQWLVDLVADVFRRRPVAGYQERLSMPHRNQTGQATVTTNEQFLPSSRLE